MLWAGGAQHCKLSLTARRQRAWLTRRHAEGPHIPQPADELLPLADRVAQPLQRPLCASFLMLSGGVPDDSQAILRVLVDVLAHQVDQLRQGRCFACRNPREVSSLTGAGLTHTHGTHSFIKVADLYSPIVVLGKNSQSHRQQGQVATYLSRVRQSAPSGPLSASGRYHCRWRR